MRLFLYTTFLFFILSSCTSGVITDPELDNLVTLLTGEFSNTDQAENDLTFAHLNLTNTRIWKDKPGYWIFSQIYDAKKTKNIYYQRIQHYERLDSLTIKSTSYKVLNIKKEERSTIDLDYLNKIKIESLEAVTGCHLYFKKETSSIYSGKTKKKSCYTSIPNVDYISSTLIVSNGKITSWTKGFNTKGKQVWGKINGPYKYIRITGKNKWLFL